MSTILSFHGERQRAQEIESQIQIGQILGMARKNAEFRELCFLITTRSNRWINGSLNEIRRQMDRCGDVDAKTDYWTTRP